MECGVCYARVLYLLDVPFINLCVNKSLSIRKLIWG